MQGNKLRLTGVQQMTHQARQTIRGDRNCGRLGQQDVPPKGAAVSLVEGAELGSPICEMGTINACLAELVWGLAVCLYSVSGNSRSWSTRGWGPPFPIPTCFRHEEVESNP